MTAETYKMLTFIFQVKLCWTPNVLCGVFRFTFRFLEIALMQRFSVKTVNSVEFGLGALSFSVYLWTVILKRSLLVFIGSRKIF